MIAPEDEVIFDISGSCTVESAVVKLLGWQKGPIYRKYIQITEMGTPSDQLPLVKDFEGGLQKFLTEERESTRQALLRAAEDGDFDEIEKCFEAIAFWEEQVRQANIYIRDLADEIAKENDSALRFDRAAERRTGEIHITINSLGSWAQARYRSSSSEHPITPSPVTEHSVSANTDSETDEDETLSTTKAANIYTTLAFAVEELMKHRKNWEKPDERPNVSELAKHLSKMAAEANRGNILGGQGHEVIQKRIATAIQIKNKKLK